MLVLSLGVSAYRNDGLLSCDLTSTSDGMVVHTLPPCGIVHSFDCGGTTLNAAVRGRGIFLAKVESTHSGNFGPQLKLLRYRSSVLSSSYRLGLYGAHDTYIQDSCRAFPVVDGGLGLTGLPSCQQDVPLQLILGLWSASQ